MSAHPVPLRDLHLPPGKVGASDTRAERCRAPSGTFLFGVSDIGPQGQTPTNSPISHLFTVCPLLRAMTRGQLLAFEISMALSNAVKAVRGLWKGLTEYERKTVAEKVVSRLRGHGDKVAA